MRPENDKRVTVHVKEAQPLSRRRLWVKIKENDIKLSGITHQGKDYVVSNSLGRGRYIMKEVEKS